MDDARRELLGYELELARRLAGTNKMKITAVVITGVQTEELPSTTCRVVRVDKLKGNEFRLVAAHESSNIKGKEVSRNGD